MKKFLSILICAVIMFAAMLPGPAFAVESERFAVEGTVLVSYTGTDENIVIPDDLGITEIGEKAFFKKSNIKTVVIPDGVKTIGAFAFAHCSLLISVSVPDSVNVIENSVFCNCFSLKYVTIPDGVTTIKYDTFAFCSALESIIIPDSVTSVGSSAFIHCTNLAEIKFSDNLSDLDGRFTFYNTAWYKSQADGIIYAGKIVYVYKGKVPENTNITLKDGTVSIAHEAFKNQTGLKSITIPEGVTAIGKNAFSACSGLESISIPGSVTSIGYGAFFDCRELKSITIPESVIDIDMFAFGYYRPDQVDVYSELKTDDVIIYCYEGSAGHKYALSNGFDYVLIKDGIQIDDVSKIISNVPAGTKHGDFVKNFENENISVSDKDGRLLSDGALVGTGAVVILFDGDWKEIDTYTVIVRGDVDGNGKVTAADSRKALRASSGLETLEGVFFDAANVNNAEKLNAAAARKILRASAKLETL